MLIHFGILNYKCLIFLLFPIFLHSQKYIKSKDNPFLRGFYDFLSLTFCGPIYLIAKLITRTKNEKIKKKQEKEKIKQIKKELDAFSRKDQEYKPFGPLIQNYEYLDKITEIKKYKLQKLQKRDKFFFILLITEFQMIAMLIKNIFRKEINRQLLQNISVLLESIFLIVFSIIFLRFSMHSHQYFSLSILALCMIIFVIQAMVLKKKNIFDLLSSILYFFSYEIFYCLSDVLGKKYLNFYIDGVYFFLFKIGITGLIPLLIYDVIAYYCGLNDNYHGIIKSIYEDNIKNWNHLLNLFSCLLFEIGVWLTIYYFSPCHFIISLTLRDFFEIISLIIENKNDKDSFESEQKITFFIFYPFMIFAVLVFNEIIILNFCGLSYNTKYYILQREKIDKDFLSIKQIILPEDNEEEQENDDGYII